MPSGRERETLKIIGGEPVKTTPPVISHELYSSQGFDCFRLLCNYLDRAGSIDVLSWGKLRIAAEGKAAVESR